MHDFLTVGAPAPLQEAGAAALSLPDELLPRSSPREYQRRRDLMLDDSRRGGFRCHGQAAPTT